LKNDLIEAENRLTQGERNGDRTLLSALLAEDFLGIDALGNRLGKKAFIARFCDYGLKFTHLEIDDVTLVQQTEADAIVIGHSAYRAEMPGRVIEGSAQFLDCWKRTGQQWQLVASAVSPESQKPN
jgi:hypothetical protein